ncbi:MAG: glycosyltransferase family 4 protein [Anaeromyxobacteraceae bacterium]
MHVALLTSLYPPSVGGIQSHTHALAEALAARGARVEVVTRRAQGHPAVAHPRRHLGVHRVGAPPGTPGPAATVAYVAGAVRAVLRLRPDVLHAHQLLSPTSAALAASALGGAPALLNPHACGAIGDVGVLSATALGRLRLRAAMRRAAGFVAISGSIRDELLAAGAPERKVHALPNGVDLERFRPPSAAERHAARARLGVRGPLAVYCGRLSPEKGVDVLVAAWPRVLAAAPGARLVVLGEGPEAARLLAGVRALGVDASVSLPGPGDPAALLAAADAFVLPSRTEGLPVALLEAMAARVPVVATAVGGSAELLADGLTGRLVPPGDPVRLGDALAGLFSDPQGAATRAAAALDLVRRRHGIGAVADHLLALYARLAAGVRARQRGRAQPAVGPRGAVP